MYSAFRRQILGLFRRGKQGFCLSNDTTFNTCFRVRQFYWYETITRTYRQRRRGFASRLAASRYHNMTTATPRCFHRYAA